MILAEDSRLRPSATVHSQRLGEELVLLHFGSGEYFGLDHVGALVWERCVGGASLGDAARSVVEAFDVGYDRALTDIFALVERLSAAKLVDIVEAR